MSGLVRKVWKGRGEGPSDGGEKGGVRPSPALAELFAGVDRSPGSGRVLDLGPAEEATLKFLGDQALEVHVAALEPDPNGGIQLPQYDPATFRAILAWDYLARVDDSARSELAAALARWLAPGGDLFLILPISVSRSPVAYRFRVAGRSELDYRPLGRLPAGISALSTRDVLSLFSSLECTGARILRHGVREFLLRRPPQGS